MVGEGAGTSTPASNNNSGNPWLLMNLNRVHSQVNNQPAT